MAKIKIYSTPQCIYCKRYKEFFKEEGIEYEDINVAEDHEAAHEMLEKSGQLSTPVLDIDGTIIAGYNLEEVKKILKID
jgi:glutaredoxin-like YruB-family protein